MAYTSQNRNTRKHDYEDTASRRESHFYQQRSSLRSDSRPQSQPRLDDFTLYHKSPDRADSETLPSPSSPAPIIPYTRSRANSSTKAKTRNRACSPRGRSAHEDPKRLEELLAPKPWTDPYELLATTQQQQSSSVPLHNLSKSQPERETAGSRGSKTRQSPSRHSSFLLGPNHESAAPASASQLDITALPGISHRASTSRMDPYAQSKRTPSAQRAARWATEMYTVSYLIFFAIFGTLARLGLQALTFYPGAPVVFSELWANVTGTFVIGYLSEDQRLFHAEWGNDAGNKLPGLVEEDGGRERARHGKVKKTVPLYIGLATGFCGSLTSFSSFMRDVFLALSNDLKAPEYHPSSTSLSTTSPRNNGYSVLAVLATIIITISTCYSALKIGAHFAILIQPITPVLPLRLTHRFLDPLFVLLGWGCWIGAAFMTIFPPSGHDAWHSQALFACCFAPFGCLLRYYLSLHLNPILPSFPLGTFTVNIFGTAVLGMSYNLQRVPLHFSGVVGGSLLGCQALQGIQDGFCGALTTVSTCIVEIGSLRRGRAYVYAGASVVTGLVLLVAIMGSVRWAVGWDEIICPT